MVMNIVKSKHHLKDQFKLIQIIRNFFLENEFLDVITPPVVSNPGMEPHIHPFELQSAKSKKKTELYLHTSPEFHMKELLSHEFERIFTICYCHRDEPESTIHRSQFLMLEWYRANERYEKIMDDCENLFNHCQLHLKGKEPSTKFNRYTVSELFMEFLGIEILNFTEKDELQSLIKKDFKDVPIPSSSESMEWDDYFFLLFLNKIEPQLKKIPYLLLYEFPAALSALSTIKESDPRICERFEIYINGIELCNCFNELTDLKIQKKRFAEQKEIKKKLYNYSLPEPKTLFSTLERGIPPSAGIALGVERLLFAITGNKQIFWR